MLSVSQYVTTTTQYKKNVVHDFSNYIYFPYKFPITKHKYIHMHKFMHMHKYMHIYKYIHYMHKFIPIDA